ncbi:MAG TPA: molybdate ABC transporter substrate-binding protein [Dinghuibacter sp.]|jgi:molybdate transport system substrate-binding protein|uniref:molybdate ABC transporter substrate-binding protein n=1 Tax=Dinghuibacter sp. TaxID=2024697 RepID=UPI002B68BCD7|nr:molybdate ABC transporter substrate-binding protein [Dinghuibacter sp.]HTJ14650.1 molybdate ABC transporter substrate-binding protein [Dinghuibacter sp.]
MRIVFLLNMLLMTGAILLTGGAAQGQQKVLVAAAADLRYAMDSLVATYTRMHPDARIEATYGSSGNFYEQIQNGGPYDLFFSADMDYVVKLKAEGKVYGNVVRYATGHLVLWSRSLDPSDKKMQLLTDPAVKKIAIANPAHAPYGKRAVESLEYYKLYDQVKDKLVLGENISQTAQFAATGSADVGLIALSLALSPSMKEGRFWRVPEASHSLLEQGYALLQHGAANTEARNFAVFITTPPAKAVLTRFGFE